jgi:hypothetical protein
MSNDIVKKQHIIPRYHIRNFSTKEDNVYKAHIYNIRTGQYFGYVPSEEHFKKRNMYEIKNENGEFIERNRVEDSLCQQEKIHSDLIKTIINRVQHCRKKDLNPRFLSQQEIIDLAGILALQFFRFPKILNELEDNTQANIAKRPYLYKFPSYTARRLVFEGCLAPRKQSTREGAVPPMAGILQIFLMFCSCSIGYTEQGNIITGDCPYFFPNGDKSLKGIDSKIGVIVFPLTSNMVLCFHSLKSFKRRHRRLFVLNDDEVLEINRRIAKGSKLICSRKKLSNDELTQILSI